ncbi:hypothetical protein ACOV1W_16455 [Paraclostridium bifermentans]|uniref:hypothetical protein n=1 Tax=Paraclostridium bifermentans TaxID=1490 RepID=UPI003D2879FB
MIIIILEEKIINLYDYNLNDYFGFIFITVNTVSNKYYIGKCKIGKRDWKYYLGSGYILKRAIKSIGRQYFVRYAVILCETEDILNKEEFRLIEKYNATIDDKFYNIADGGSGGNTMRGYSEEKKKQYAMNMSNIMKDKIKNDTEYLNKVSEGVKTAFKRPEVQQNIKNAQRKRYQKESERLKTGLASKKVWDNRSDEDKNLIISKLVALNKSAARRKELSERWSGSNNPKYGKDISKEHKEVLAKAREKVVCKKTYMYDENMKLIQIFTKRKDVLSFLNLRGHSQLMKYLNSNTLYKGYFWKTE